MTIAELKLLKESEDNVEFKEARNGFSFDGSDHKDQIKRRKCLLGYIVALANEGGGMLILGMSDRIPHTVVGTEFLKGRIKKAEDNVYISLKIRVQILELFENDLRVVCVKIPGRPLGRYLDFEGVPLMRTGDSLRNMDQTMIWHILSEQEPDFSAKICEGVRPIDLDIAAIVKMRQAYSRKNGNPNIMHLPLPQLLSDLRLANPGGKLTHAALILLGQEDIISRELPQASIIWEFRYTISQTPYNFREVIRQPLFIAIDRIWELINDKNSPIPMRDQAYIFPTHVFNEEVIREAILNAIAHRDYTMQSEVVIRQYPYKIEIHNPGGFPKGVSLENLVTVSSTPRSRLMTEVLEKTGLVERSGQGVDKIYSLTLQEGKAEPDYTHSNMYQVSLILDGKMEDPAFSTFIRKVQNVRTPEEKLGVQEIIGLHRLKQGQYANINSGVIRKLEEENLIFRTTNSSRYELPINYYELTSEENRIGTRYFVKEVKQVLAILQNRKLKMGELETELVAFLNRNQIKYLITKLVEDGIVTSEGTGRGTKYLLVQSPGTSTDITSPKHVLEILHKKYVDVQ
ncbi:AAA family ATPase [Chitinophaga sp. SYP-B3965]|uniref:ATP-binding protein n=1 Tax=Chitinophaga sp. SYP-B3965 TaxID=2663120 RepID=UPI0012997C62|nr:ATP-binding protein [Chitinophaga sp. SYP-B3965]MRG46127.1 AAA family ATPase [Chitinophaga sp. SYP-B3965]